MNYKTLFYTQLALLVAIAIVHAFALMFDLYWHYPLLNRVIHFSGGLWVALACVNLFQYFAFTAGFPTILALVIVVSVAWEIFEVAIGMTHEENYIIDTSLDLLMDVLGGGFGYLAARPRAVRDTIEIQ